MKYKNIKFTPPVGPIERRTTVVVDGDTYEVLEGLNNIMVRRRCMMPIAALRRSVPYWLEVKNKDELREVLAALPKMSQEKDLHS